ncbi:allantoinase [uncultured Paenibacillus sp.]|uniref:allantoinase n=1 Tax=uncultured Paenibacillus sp. TaxID=227322 RepID=UPI0028D1BAF4|nr:allantoinase [uncultured Paenibacillus sp.]
MVYDRVVRNGEVVMPDGVKRMDIGIRHGVIAEIAERLEGAQGATVLDAEGLLVMPGMIDAHVHFNEPGMGHWEGFETGSAALAAGGCTAYLDMPLNGNPPTVTPEALRLKASLAANRSRVDYGFWGGLVPGNLEQLQPLSDAGVPAFKAFISNPGGEGEGRFREVDDWTLYEGMKRIASFGGLLALHAENDGITAALAAAAGTAGRNGARDYAAARPIVAELEAVNKSLLFAELTGCRLHFVHISSAAAVERIAGAKKKGLDVTAETCPHYLLLTENDMERLGPVAKCAPPLRSADEQAALWAAVEEGLIDLIASDHSPCPTALKTEASSFFDAWGGISGAQNSLELMLSEGVIRRGLSPVAIAELTARNPADRFGLGERKGRIAPGYDADLALVDMRQPYTLQEEQLLYRHKQSPYTDMTIGCKVAATLCRGHIVYRAGSEPEAREHGRPMWAIR